MSTGAAAIASASIFVAERIEHRVRVGQCREQRGPVGAVDVADVEVRTEGVDRGGREFFGDEHDGLRHESGSFGAGARAAAGKRVDAAPHAIGAQSRHTLSARPGRPAV